MSRPVKPATEASECRSCGALILWVEWAKSGKKMPIDVTPSDDGDVAVTYRKAENKLIASKAAQLTDEELRGRNLYLSHFSTCPNAGEHRRAR
jgi:hypothetical protein